MFITIHAPLCSDLNSVLQLLVVTEDSQASLTAILDHSIVKSLEQIHSHFDSIPSKKGTKILIWNIRRSESHVRVTLKLKHDKIRVFHATNISLPPLAV